MDATQSIPSLSPFGVWGLWAQFVHLDCPVCKDDQHLSVERPQIEDKVDGGPAEASSASSTAGIGDGDKGEELAAMDVVTLMKLCKKTPVTFCDGLPVVEKVVFPLGVKDDDDTRFKNSTRQSSTAMFRSQAAME